MHYRGAAPATAPPVAATPAPATTTAATPAPATAAAAAPAVVERIITAEERAGEMHYLIKWRGRGEQANTWVALSALPGTRAVELAASFEEAMEEDDKVGRFEVFEAGDVRLVIRIDFARVGIDRIEHHAVESVAGGKDLCELCESLFAPVFLITADEHDPLALARASGSLNREPGGVCLSGGDPTAASEGKDRGEEKSAHDGAPNCAARSAIPTSLTAAWELSDETPQAGNGGGFSTAAIRPEPLREL